MKKTAALFRKFVAAALALMLLVSIAPVRALSGGTEVTMTPFQQFCGAYINLGGTSYLCAVDLGAPTIDSASDTVITAGTTVRMDLFFSINDGWYACRKQEMQGDPNDIFTVRFNKALGGDRVSDTVWKTYPDDGYGERYYLEFTVLGGDTEAPIDVSIALTQPDAGNVGADYRITGTSAAYSTCAADFNLPGYSGPCDVYFGDPVTSTGDAAAMVPGATVCFPLMFMGGDGQLYAAYNTELQGDPNTLFELEQSSEALLTKVGWKTWDNGHWYLEYTVGQGDPGDTMTQQVRLRQSAAYKATPWKSFSSTMGQKGQCSAPISIGGTVYDCTVDLQGYLTSTGNVQNMTADSTVCFPLMFLGGDGNWYPVLAGELQGDPAALFTIAETITSGNALLTRNGWKTWENGHYYVEYSVADSQYETELQLSVQLKQDSVYRQGGVVSFSGKAPASANPVWRQCVAPISIGGTVYDCIVDIQGYLTSSGSDTLTQGGSVCFPLMFQGGDGQWYPVLASELQGAPDSLFEVQETVVSGGALLTKVGWGTWENGHYYLEYAVADAEFETAVDFSVKLVQSAAGKYGDAVQFAGTVPASDDPYWKTCRVPISIGGTVYECVVDLQGYLTSTGTDDLNDGGTVCFPLMFLGGDGQWYPVLKQELQGVPGELLTVETAVQSGADQLQFVGWGNWDSGHYFAEFKVTAANAKTDLLFTAQLKKDADHVGTPVTFAGTIAGKAIYCSVPISIGGTVYDCLTNLGNPVTSTGKVDLQDRDTVCFPLEFMGGDGNWYPVLASELQGTPETLYELKQTFVSGGQCFGKPVWKNDWPNGAYYLEYTLLEPGEKQDIVLSVQLFDGTVTTPAKTFTGTVNSIYGQWAERLAMEYPAADNQGKVILLGTSTFEYWRDYASHMAPLDTLNFGMGGSYIVNLANVTDTLLAPYAPQAVVLLAGGNDIMVLDAGADQVTAELTEFVNSVMTKLPGTPVFVVSINENLTDTEAKRIAKKTVNERMKALCDATDDLYFIDTAAAINPEYDSKREEYFSSDKVHLNGVGYSVYGPVVAETVCEVLNVKPSNPEPEPAPGVLTVPIKISGTVYDCIVDLQGYLTSSGSNTLSGGGTVAFPLMFLGGDGVWYPVLKEELQGDPAQLFSAVCSASSGAGLLTQTGWGCWSNGHYYLEYTVANAKDDTDVSFSVQLRQTGNKIGSWVSFSGKVPGAGDAATEDTTEAEKQCVVPIQIEGTVYDCIVDLQGSLTSSGANTLDGSGTVAFPLMFLGGDGVWYPVLKDELQGDPSELLGHTLNAVSGGELLTCTGWGYWESGHYYLEYKVSAPEETTELEFGVTLTCGDASGTEDVFTGYVQPGPDISSQQIPLKPSASLVVERLEECQDFNTMSFTINGVRYNDGWPIDFESPNTASAVITDGTIIRSDLCFKVNGQWYPVRQQECNESIEELFTYDYQVLSGEEFLSVPRFTTRYDAYGDIWQFEVAVNSEEEGEFSFTLQLVSRDGAKTGSKYKVTGRVQNGQMTSTVEEIPEEGGNGWLWAVGVGGIALVAVIVIVLLLRKKKENR